ncbi:MAG: lysophospholipid acyltransferase family protein [Bdellovibrionota bacterium]
MVSFFLWSCLILLRKFLFLPPRYDAHLMRSCAIWVMWSLELTIRIENLDLYDPKEPAVVIANHSSLIDIPLIYMTCSPNLRMLAKREMFWIPLMGWALWAAKHVAIHRGHKNSATRAKSTLTERLSEGFQIFLAPEGTRSATGCLLRFKSGAFRIAAEQRVPIYVLALYKPWEVLPKGDLYSKYKGEQVSRFLGKINPIIDEYSVKSTDELIQEARKLYINNGFVEC